MKLRYLTFGFLAFGLIACTQATPQTSQPKILGVLEVAINDSTIGAAKFIPAKLGSQALINENEITFAPAAGIGGTSLSLEANPRSFDYVSRIFTVTNKIGGIGAMNNVSLVALAQTGNAAPTTAIKTIANFNGNASTAAIAQVARPTHRMTGSGTVSVDATEPYRASFQAFTSGEVTTMQSQIAALGYTGTVLEYGFVASSTGATASRTLPDGASANVAIAMRFPAGGGVGAYNFVMTFVVLEGGATRVTRSPEESTANANTRAGNVTTSPVTTATKVLIDDPAVIIGANIPTGYTVQNNVKIGTGASQTLLKPAKLVLARVYGGGSGGFSLFNSDFVEIFNAGEFSVSANGKSLQYGSAAGNLGSVAGDSVNITSLGIVAPGGYKMVSTVNQSNSSGVVSPTSDATTTWSAALGFLAGGKVALVNGTTLLNCGATATPCDSTQDNSILDLLGYQRSATNVSKFETAKFDYSSTLVPTLDSNDSFTRAGNGCTDNNNNSTDFSIVVLTLASVRNNSTTPFICP